MGHFTKTYEIPRPTGWMENPYIGKDGKDYHDPLTLKIINAEYSLRMF